jgi:hypothetical protein
MVMVDVERTWSSPWRRPSADRAATLLEGVQLVDLVGS